MSKLKINEIVNNWITKYNDVQHDEKRNILTGTDLPPLVIPPNNIQYYFYSGKDEVA